MRDEAMMQLQELRARVEALERSRATEDHRLLVRVGRLLAKFVLWMFQHPVNNQPEQLSMKAEAESFLKTLERE